MAHRTGVPENNCRGRDGHCWPPPAQIRTSASTHTALTLDDWRRSVLQDKGAAHEAGESSGSEVALAGPRTCAHVGSDELRWSARSVATDAQRCTAARDFPESRGIGSNQGRPYAAMHRLAPAVDASETSSQSACAADTRAVAVHAPEALLSNSADPLMPEITDSSEAPGRQSRGDVSQ